MYSPNPFRFPAFSVDREVENMRARDSGTENEIMNFDIWSMIHVNHHLEIESCNVVDRSVERAIEKRCTSKRRNYKITQALTEQLNGGTPIGSSRCKIAVCGPDLSCRHPHHCHLCRGHSSSLSKKAGHREKCPSSVGFPPCISPDPQ
jgi:hypothetical protein